MVYSCTPRWSQGPASQKASVRNHDSSSAVVGLDPMARNRLRRPPRWNWASSTERFAAAEMGYPQVVHLEGEAGSGKSTLLSRFLGSLSNAVIVQAGGDEDEVLLSYGVIDQLEPGSLTEPGADPMAVGVSLLELLDRLQSEGQVVVLVVDDLQWVDRPSSRALLFALRRLRADKVLTVISARAGGSTDPGWSRFLSGDSRVTQIRLGGLDSRISWIWQLLWTAGR